MPLYEDRKNAENIISVDKNCHDSIIAGNAAYAGLVEAIKEKSRQLNRPAVAAFDGWYGVEWENVISALKQSDKEGAIGTYLDISEFFRPIGEIKSYKQKYITEDPGFGYVNGEGAIEDLLDMGKLENLPARIQANTVIFGCGSAVPALEKNIDLIVYFDITRQPVLWKMWGGRLVPFGCDAPDADYGWKEYYYCDYYLLDRQKRRIIEKMGYWVEAIDPSAPKMMPKPVYDAIIQKTLKYPIKEIKIYQPGPWGAYRYRDLFDVPGLECNAWNELAGPELGMILNLNGTKKIEMPMLNLMQYQEEFLGKYLAAAYPNLFPMDVWLDDGYFPEKTPMERTAMPLHNHPSTDYVARHFNEPLGRYETYYICEAYEGACSMMGFKENADLEEWEALCRESENMKEIKNWRDYISIWDSNVGDLYLIPPGTVHGHGGNQMVLEMDTCPSVAATEYSFFEYDFARNSWDDEKKAMTARPVKMHIEHGFDTEKWRRENWVKENLLARPKVEKWTKDYKFDRYASVPEMPFEIERFHFYEKAEYSTKNKFAHIATLTIGKKAVIQSKENPEFKCSIDLFQSAIVPASFGEYEILSGDGGFCEIVLMKWKEDRQEKDQGRIGI
ncbi:MAG: hypothetical protein FWG34_03885 [Oscillospiraceae bacterium]|nr:hypothetical protein [Oscillospiraceae bacterium]